MIQINLLPDIKREYLRSQRVKKLFILGSFIASAAAIGGVVLMWLFTLGQNVHLGNLQDDIDTGLSELQSFEDLDKVVTIQNQLAVIESLDNGRPEAAFLFDYLTLITPNDIDLGSVEVNFVENLVMEINGVGKGFREVNGFVDTIKNTQFSHEESGGDLNAFTNVVLASAGGQDSGKQETGFRITLNFNEAIYDNNRENLVLKVPKITSSQSETERPKSLFEPSAQQPPEGEGL